MTYDTGWTVPPSPAVPTEVIDENSGGLAAPPSPPPQRPPRNTAGIWQWITTHKRLTLIIVAALGVFAFYASTWEATPEQESETLGTPPPQFQEEDLRSQMAQQANDHGNSMTGFFLEEDQRIVAAIAQQFRALAVYYIQQPDHPCYGKSEYQCLITFDENRIDQLRTNQAQERVEAEGINPMNAFRPVYEVALEMQITKGLLAAQIVTKPPGSRLAWEQTYINELARVYGTQSNFDPRPQTLANLLAKSQQMRLEMQALSQESISEQEYCLGLSPEAQEARGGCY